MTKKKNVLEKKKNEDEISSGRIKIIILILIWIKAQNSVKLQCHEIFNIPFHRHLPFRSYKNVNYINIYILVYKYII